MNDRYGNNIGVLCKVCGDRASGKHYGVPSCDGCRGFFKRSIRRNLEYICKEGGKCVVDLSRRNQCQACRFAKCLEVNMRREAVQHERAPKVHSSAPVTPHQPTAINYHPNIYSGFNTLRHNDIIFPLSMHFPNLEPYHLPNTHYYPMFNDSMNFKFYDSYKQAATASPCNLEIGRIITNNLFSKVVLNNDSKSTTTTHKEDEVTSSEETSNIATPITNKNDDLFGSATKLLYLAVKWAKSIPSFNEFSINDQKQLLEESWAELFVVAAAQWGLPIDDDFLKLNPHLQHLKTIAKNFILLKIDQFEAACLKALILFKSDDNKNLNNLQQISLLQNQTLCLLLEKGGGLRLGHLLLNLPLIKIAGNSMKLQEIFFKHTLGDAIIDKILEETIKL